MALPSTGYVVPNYDEVYEDLSTRLKTNLDPNLDIDDNTAIGQLVGAISGAITDIYEFAGAVNDSRKLHSAEGINLDDIGALTRNPRDSGTASTGVLNLKSTVSYAGANVVVPAGTTFANSTSGDQYTLDSTVGINESSCNYVKIQLASVAEDVVYSVTVNGLLGGPYTETVDTSVTWPVTVQDIIQTLSANLNITAFSDLTSVVTSTDSFTIATDNPTDSMEVIVSPAALDIIECGSIGNITGVINSTNVDDIGTITAIVTPATGLDVVSNPLPTSAGTDAETDTEYRNSIIENAAVIGGGTFNSLYAKLLDLDGVSFVNVEENLTETTTPSGIDPHSFRVTIEGGLVGNIVQTIWDSKPLGINTNGSEVAYALDVTGSSRAVRFSRPSTILIEVTVTLVVDTENGSSTDTALEREAEIKSVIYNDGLIRYRIGKDVVASSFYEALYRDTSGYRFDDVSIRWSSDGGLNWTTPPSGYVVISDNQKPIITEDNVIVIDNT